MTQTDGTTIKQYRYDHIWGRLALSLFLLGLWVYALIIVFRAQNLTAKINGHVWFTGQSAKVYWVFLLLTLLLIIISSLYTLTQRLLNPNKHIILTTTSINIPYRFSDFININYSEIEKLYMFQSKRIRSVFITTPFQKLVIHSCYMGGKEQFEELYQLLMQFTPHAVQSSN